MQTVFPSSSKSVLAIFTFAGASDLLGRLLPGEPYLEVWRGRRKLERGEPPRMRWRCRSCWLQSLRIRPKSCSPPGRTSSQRPSGVWGRRPPPWKFSVFPSKLLQKCRLRINLKIAAMLLGGWWCHLQCFDTNMAHLSSLAEPHWWNYLGSMIGSVQRMYVICSRMWDEGKKEIQDGLPPCRQAWGDVLYKIFMAETSCGWFLYLKWERLC